MKFEAVTISFATFIGTRQVKLIPKDSFTWLFTWFTQKNKPINVRVPFLARVAFVHPPTPSPAGYEVNGKQE